MPTPRLTRTLVAVAVATSALSLATAHHASAQPTAMCVVRAHGVPGDSGTPKPWFPLDPTSTAPPPVGSPSDPRWVGASGHSVAGQGAAIAPVELRSTWGREGTQDYLYLSWQFYYTTGLLTSAHVLHVAFLQPETNLDDPSARVFRFRFRGASMIDPATYCANPFGAVTGCADGTTSGIYTQFQRRMLELEDAAIVPATDEEQCGEIVAGKQFQAMPAAGAGNGTVSWAETIRYWNENGRWAVQLRIPVVDGTRDLSVGIDEKIQIAYQASVELAPSGEGFHRWPRDERMEPHRKALICDVPGSNPAWLDVDPAATDWRKVHVMGGGPDPMDPDADACGAGVSIDWLDIGALDGAGNISPLFNTTAGGDGVVRNTLVARIQNHTTSNINTGQMTARFRIANWGSQVPGSESWTDVPIGPYDTDAGALPPAEATNAAAIPAGTTDRQIQLPWAMTDLQFCQYTNAFATSPAWTAKCERCDLTSAGDSAGVQVQGTTICAAPRSYHQCMAVELRGGDVDYDRRGVARNMDFAALSSDEQVATIDLRGMPPAAGQTMWEVFLLAMPRNVPATVPAGTTGLSLIATQARAVVAAIAPGAGGAPDTHQPMRRAALAMDLGGLRRPLPPINELPQPNPGGFDGFPRNVRPTLVELDRIARIDDGANIKAEELTVGLTQSFSGSTVAQLVPTLDVYVFVRSVEGASALSPLNSFVLIGHHEGALIGMRAGIDGAERIVPPPPSSATEPAGPRVYRLQVPVNGTVDVRPWMQALVDGEQPRLDDPTWGKPKPDPIDTDRVDPPCVEPPQGCCRCSKGKKCPPKTSWQLFGETIPFGIAAVIAGWRSRRRKRDK